MSRRVAFICITNSFLSWSIRENVSLPWEPSRKPSPECDGLFSLAEASGSRTHLRHGVPHAGFEDQAQHRPRLASSVILAPASLQPVADAPACVPARPKY